MFNINKILPQNIFKFRRFAGLFKWNKLIFYCFGSIWLSFSLSLLIALSLTMHKKMTFFFVVVIFFSCVSFMGRTLSNHSTIEHIYSQRRKRNPFLYACIILDQYLWLLDFVNLDIEIIIWTPHWTLNNEHGTPNKQKEKELRKKRHKNSHRIFKSWMIYVKQFTLDSNWIEYNELKSQITKWL